MWSPNPAIKPASPARHSDRRPERAQPRNQSKKPSPQAIQTPNIKSKIVNIQLIAPLPLHELAQIVRKSAIFLVPKIAKSLRAKELNFFIFLPRSKIVHAQLVLCGPHESAKYAPVPPASRRHPRNPNRTQNPQ